jgi:hypothetical protein
MVTSAKGLRPILSSERAPQKNKTVTVKVLGLDTKTY